MFHEPAIILFKVCGYKLMPADGLPVNGDFDYPVFAFSRPNIDNTDDIFDLITDLNKS